MHTNYLTVPVGQEFRHGLVGFCASQPHKVLIKVSARTGFSSGGSTSNKTSTSKVVTFNYLDV